MTRDVWKWWYRQIRVARREAGKALMDTMIYGSGYVRIDVEGDCKHVPFAEISILRDTTRQKTEE